MPKDEYTEQEAAEQLLVSTRTLARARAAGKIDYIRDGNSILYTHEALIAFEERMADE